MDERDKKRASSHWDDAARAEVGRSHRARTASPHGVPILADSTTADGEIDVDDRAPDPSDIDEVTSPIDLLRRDLDSDELELLEQLGGRDEDRGGALGFVVKLATRLNDVKKDERRDNRRRADQIAVVAADAGNQHLGMRMETVERKLRFWQGIALAALAAAFGSLVAVGKGLYERGEREGGDAIRLEHVERAIVDNRGDIRDLRDWLNESQRRTRWLSPPSPAVPATKGTP